MPSFFCHVAVLIFVTLIVGSGISMILGISMLSLQIQEKYMLILIQKHILRNLC